MSENPYQAPTVAEVSAESDAEITRRKYLSHEASVKGVGSLYLLGGVLGVLGILAMIVGMVEAIRRGGQVDEVSAGLAESIVGIVVGAVVVVLQLIAGFGLRKLTKPGRIIGAAVAGISLIGFPIGTIIGAYILYLLLGAKGKVVFSPEYKEVIAQTPHIRYRTSKWVWIILFLVVGLILAGAAALFFSVHSSR